MFYVKVIFVCETSVRRWRWLNNSII